ncbi:hypothetical protein KUCAC02_020588, partial [Chaenocephalus aceratus]
PQGALLTTQIAKHPKVQGTDDSSVLSKVQSGQKSPAHQQSSVSWPLVLHSFCSELTDSSNQKLLLIGGGGNGFSFGTRLNLQPVTLDLRAALG